MTIENVVKCPECGCQRIWKDGIVMSPTGKSNVTYAQTAPTDSHIQNAPNRMNLKRDFIFRFKLRLR